MTAGGLLVPKKTTSSSSVSFSLSSSASKMTGLSSPVFVTSSSSSVFSKEKRRLADFLGVGLTEVSSSSLSDLSLSDLSFSSKRVNASADPGSLEVSVTAIEAAAAAGGVLISVGIIAGGCLTRNVVRVRAIF